MGGLATGAGNKRAPHAERGVDLYETPEVAVDALIRAEGHRLPMDVWEPACGPGNIARALRRHGRKVWATDLVDYRTPDQDRGEVGFLLPAIETAQAIVTNPPFMHAQAFVRLALERAPYVAMLLRLAFMESERRRDILDNGDLARVWVFRNRLPMMHRAGWEGRKANSGMAFAWFVWERGHNAPATLRRISWERQG